MALPRFAGHRFRTRTPLTATQGKFFRSFVQRCTTRQAMPSDLRVCELVSRLVLMMVTSSTGSRSAAQRHRIVASPVVSAALASLVGLVAVAAQVYWQVVVL